MQKAGVLCAKLRSGFLVLDDTVSVVVVVVVGEDGDAVCEEEEAHDDAKVGTNDRTLG